MERWKLRDIWAKNISKAILNRWIPQYIIIIFLKHNLFLMIFVSSTIRHISFLYIMSLRRYPEYNMAVSVYSLQWLNTQPASCLPLTQASVVIATCYGAALIGIQPRWKATALAVLLFHPFYLFLSVSLPFPFFFTCRQPDLSKNLHHNSSWFLVPVCKWMQMPVPLSACRPHATQWT